MLAKTFLVLVYFLLVFLAAKVLDITSSWLDLGCVATQLFNPVALSVKKLKNLLDERGVSYAGVADKRDLAKLVEESGSLSTDENCTTGLENHELQPAAEINTEVTHFRSSSHLFEEVEDTKASGWLVHVLPRQKKPLLRETQWQKLTRKVNRFGIRTGVFDCNLEPVLCSVNNWGEKCLILSSPARSDKPKGHVAINVYKSKPSVELVFGWMNNILAKKIQRVDDREEYLNFVKNDAKTFPETKVVMFSRLDDPPALLSTLSIKFTGRVRFAYSKITPHKNDDFPQTIGVHKVPGLLIITPEIKTFYGSRKGETFRYYSLELFLTTIDPEVNDLFLISIIFLNMVSFLELFLTPGGVLRKSFRYLLLVGTANTMLITIWLPLMSVAKLTFFQPVLGFALRISRYIMTSNIASLGRYYFIFHQNSVTWFLVGFLAYCLFLTNTKRRLKCILGSDDEDDAETTDWFYQDIAYFRRFFYSFPTNRYTTPNGRAVEESLEIFIQRLAIPDLWLHPILPTDFVKDLPVWQMCGCAHQNEVGENDSKLRCNSNVCEKTNRPNNVLLGAECVICLELYIENCFIVSLPCLHGFHQQCLEKWFNAETNCRSLNCPVCRWPAYKQKSQIINITSPPVMDSSSQ